MDYDAMDYIRLFLNNKRLIALGFMLTFFSSFGQTFLLSLYVPHIINDFQLTNTFFGGLYALATVFSSIILVYAGRLIDHVDLKKYSLWSALALMLSCLVLAFAGHVFMIFAALLGLRFAGQGLLSHISSTTISKHFNETRGKALSITSLGYSSGEGFFPVLMSLVIAVVGWRHSMVINAAAVGFLLIPFIWLALSRYEQHNPVDSQPQGRTISRAFLFKDKNFYLIAANSIALPFLVTGLFFHQSSLAAFKGWSLEWLSLCFLGFAIGRTVFSLISGQLIDTYSATKLISFYLLPFILGLLVLLLFDNQFAALFYLIMTGVSVGMSSTIKSAAIAEIYGTAHLGGIRSLFATLMVLSTATSPLLFGLLLDHGFHFSVILVFSIVTGSVASLLGSQISIQYTYAFQPSKR